MASLERISDTTYRIHPPIDCRDWLWAESVYGKKLRFRERVRLILIMPWWNEVARELNLYRQWLHQQHYDYASKQERSVRCGWRPDTRPEEANASQQAQPR